MIKIILVVVVLLVSMTLGRCGGRYPFSNCDSNSNPVYYGPEYYEQESDDNGGRYPADVEESVDVYGGPDFFGEEDADVNEEEEYPDGIDAPSDVYGGPEYFDDENDGEKDNGGKYPDDTESPMAVYFGPQG